MGDTEVAGGERGRDHRQPDQLAGEPGAIRRLGRGQAAVATQPRRGGRGAVVCQRPGPVRRLQQPYPLRLQPIDQPPNRPQPLPLPRPSQPRRIIRRQRIHRRHDPRDHTINISGGWRTAAVPASLGRRVAVGSHISIIEHTFESTLKPAESAQSQQDVDDRPNILGAVTRRPWRRLELAPVSREGGRRRPDCRGSGRSNDRTCRHTSPGAGLAPASADRRHRWGSGSWRVVRADPRRT
jgi:hypothetical protein